MKAVLFVALISLAFAVASEVAFSKGLDTSFLEVEGNCFPDCQWNCDAPTCPAVCEPQCEKPNCELRCEKLPETKCDIRCEKPKCEVRCSRKNCASGGCPLCENVCLPAKCQTVCTPAIPNCKPTCSAPKCTWLCRKPASCPKPKCDLACSNRPKPAAPSCANPSGSQCCPCARFESLRNAVLLATETHVRRHGKAPHDEMLPSMVEVAHEIRFRNKEGSDLSAGCCPCT